MTGGKTIGNRYICSESTMRFACTRVRVKVVKKYEILLLRGCWLVALISQGAIVCRERSGDRQCVIMGKWHSIEVRPQSSAIP